jgi:hypothetical protein
VTASATTPAVLNIDPAAERAAVPGDPVDLLLPLGEGAPDITAPQPHLARELGAQAMLADWVFSRATQVHRAPSGPGRPQRGEPPVAVGRRGIKLDLDLSEHAPAPREFTRPAAFTDIDMRRDSRLSDLGGLDEADSDPTPLPSRR